MKTIYTLLIAILCLSAAPIARAQNAAVLKRNDLVNIELKTPAEDAPNVTSQYTVSDNGTIRLPMLDREIAAVGLTPSALARRIEEAYKSAQIYTNPAINAFLHTDPSQATHVVIVGGEVRQPGEFPLRQGMTLMAAISRSGGFGDFADPKKVKLIRANKEFIFDCRKIDARGSNNPLLQDGDYIIVPQD